MTKLQKNEDNGVMEFAANHAKILIGVVAMVLVGTTAIIADIPGSDVFPSPTSAPVTPTPNVGDSATGRVKADTFGITIVPTNPITTVPGSCAGGMAIDLLLDTSSSMKDPRSDPKIDALKEAVNNFITQIPDDAVVTIQRFDKQARSVFSPMLLKDARGAIHDAVDELRPAGEGGTHVKEGLYRAKKMMDEANQMFPGRSWTLIIISDGSPNPYPGQEGTAVASELKNAGVNIVTIGLDLDQEVNVSPEKAKQLMRDMASSPAQFYDASSDDISTIYRLITGNLCQ